MLGARATFIPRELKERKSHLNCFWGYRVLTGSVEDVPAGPVPLVAWGCGSALSLSRSPFPSSAASSGGCSSPQASLRPPLLCDPEQDAWPLCASVTPSVSEGNSQASLRHRKTTRAFIYQSDTFHGLVAQTERLWGGLARLQGEGTEVEESSCAG